MSVDSSSRFFRCFEQLQARTSGKKRNCEIGLPSTSDIECSNAGFTGFAHDFYGQSEPENVFSSSQIRLPAVLPASIATLSKAEAMKILVCWDLFMSHTCFPDVIHQKVWGPRVDRRSGAYVARLHKIQETYDTLQSELLRNMEHHILARFERNPSMMEVTEADLRDWLARSFDSEKFFAVWNFMKGYLSIDTSSDLGWYFALNVYVNLAAITARISRLLLQGSGGHRYTLLSLRDSVKQFFKAIPHSEVFDQVDKSDFDDITGSQPDRTSMDVTKLLGQSFVPIGRPPRKPEPF